MTEHQLKAWRKRLGLNKTRAAEALGLSPEAYGRLEKRGSDRRTDLACAAIAFGLPPAVG